MLEAGPCSVPCWDSSKAAWESFDIPWKWLNFLGSSRRPFLDSYLNSFLPIGLRCVPGCSMGLLPGICKSVLAFSGDGGIPR